MELSSVLGWIATMFFTICSIPQIMKTKRAESLVLYLRIVAHGRKQTHIA